MEPVDLSVKRPKQCGPLDANQLNVALGSLLCDLNNQLNQQSQQNKNVDLDDHPPAALKRSSAKAHNKQPPAGQSDAKPAVGGQSVNQLLNAQSAKEPTTSKKPSNESKSSSKSSDAPSSQSPSRQSSQQNSNDSIMTNLNSLNSLNSKLTQSNSLKQLDQLNQLNLSQFEQLSQLDKLNQLDQLSQLDKLSQLNQLNLLNQQNLLSQSSHSNNKLAHQESSAISKFMQHEKTNRLHRANSALSALSSKSTKSGASSQQAAAAAQLLANNFPQFKLDLNQLTWLSNLLAGQAADSCKESNNNSLNVKDRNKTDLRQNRLKADSHTGLIDSVNLERIKQESK